MIKIKKILCDEEISCDEGNFSVMKSTKNSDLRTPRTPSVVNKKEIHIRNIMVKVKGSVVRRQ